MVDRMLIPMVIMLIVNARLPANPTACGIVLEYVFTTRMRSSC